MRRFILAVMILPFLCGCAAIQNAFCIASDDFVAGVNSPVTGDNVGILENHDGMMCTWGITEGQMGGCVKLDAWESHAWRLAREAVGAPTDVCVTCIDGQVLCP